MSRIYTTNILDFVISKRGELLRLQNKEAAVQSHKFADMNSMSAISKLSLLDQQSAIITGLQRALNESVKVAAALAEAAALAKDGIIDPSDVFDCARRALIDGTVKLSSLNDAFDLSPGQITGNAIGQSGVSSRALDPLTSTLRSIQTSPL